MTDMECQFQFPGNRFNDAGGCNFFSCLIHQDKFDRRGLLEGRQFQGNPHPAPVRIRLRPQIFDAHIFGGFAGDGAIGFWQKEFHSGDYI
jgi:hypothetical protein